MLLHFRNGGKGDVAYTPTEFTYTQKITGWLKNHNLQTKTAERFFDEDCLTHCGLNFNMYI